jgi:hypothetical protein
MHEALGLVLCSAKNERERERERERREEKGWEGGKERGLIKAQH